MQTIFPKAVAVLVAGVLGSTAVSAHPGHAPLDLTAQVSAPFAGPDHLMAFVGLSALLLIVARGLRKTSTSKRATANARIKR